MRVAYAEKSNSRRGAFCFFVFLESEDDGEDDGFGLGLGVGSDSEGVGDGGGGSCNGACAGGPEGGEGVVVIDFWGIEDPVNSLMRAISSSRVQVS